MPRVVLRMTVQHPTVGIDDLVEGADVIAVRSVEGDVPRHRSRKPAITGSPFAYDTLYEDPGGAFLRHAVFVPESLKFLL
jgi:hypothetical protein